MWLTYGLELLLAALASVVVMACISWTHKPKSGGKKHVEKNR